VLLSKAEQYVIAAEEAKLQALQALRSSFNNILEVQHTTWCVLPHQQQQQNSSTARCSSCFIWV